MATKPEPLFPTIAACPSCGKRTRLKVEKLSHVPRGVDGVGYLLAHALVVEERAARAKQ